MSQGVGAPGALSTASNAAAPNGLPSPSVPAPAQAPVSNTGKTNQNGKRELSPDRNGTQPPAKSIKANHGDDAKSAPNTSPDKSARSQTPAPAPAGREQAIDLRAEEEAARRAYSRAPVGNMKFAGANSRAQHTDLFGEQAFKTRLNKFAQQHNMTMDPDAMRYLAVAAETRMRALISSAVRAHEHRVKSTHLGQPPMAAVGGSKEPTPLWSHRVTSDPSAVMIALTGANRDSNKAHRVARTERNARETEMARAAAAARERDGDVGGQAGPSDSAAANGGPGADKEGEGDSPSASGGKSKEPVFQSSPTFGGPPQAKKGGKGKKSKDISAEYQAKMTNARATQVSGGRKRYAWEMGGAATFRPQVPSLLSGKRKKEKGKDKDMKDEGEEDADPVKEEPGKSTTSSTNAPDTQATVTGSSMVSAKKKKKPLAGTQRRPIDVERMGDGKAKDDTALTVADFAFALDHSDGMGMGTNDEVLRRLYARPGGPYGKWRAK